MLGSIALREFYDNDPNDTWIWIQP